MPTGGNFPRGRLTAPYALLMLLSSSIAPSCAKALATDPTPRTDTILSGLPDAATLTAQKASKIDVPPLQQLPEPCSDHTDNEDLRWIDRTHLKISQSLCDRVNEFDEFFGNFDYNDTQTRSFIRIRNEISWENLSGINTRFKPRIRAKIRLPALENRLNLIISDEPQENTSLSNNIEQSQEQIDNNEDVTTALRWTARAEGHIETDFDVGARFNSGLDGFVRGRYRYTKPIGLKNLLRFRQEIFWRNSEGVGEATQINFQHQYSNAFLLESSSSATFSEASQGVDWSQRFSVYQKLDPLRALSYNILALGYTRPGFTTENYGISMRYRKNIYSHWLYAELEPEITWPLTNNREFTQKIIFRIEAQLGKL